MEVGVLVRYDTIDEVKVGMEAIDIGVGCAVVERQIDLFHHLLFSEVSNRYSLNLWKALPRWLIAFFSSVVISAYVFLSPLPCSSSVGSKMGSHPKSLLPLAGTIRPSVLPSNN